MKGSHLVRLPCAASGPGAGFSSKTDLITSFWEVSCSVCIDNYFLSTYFVQSLLRSLHTLLLGHKLCHQIDSQGDETSTRKRMLPSATCCVADTPGVEPSVGSGHCGSLVRNLAGEARMADGCCRTRRIWPDRRAIRCQQVGKGSVCRGNLPGSAS